MTMNFRIPARCVALIVTLMVVGARSDSLLGSCDDGACNAPSVNNPATMQQAAVQPEWLRRYYANWRRSFGVLQRSATTATDPEFKPKFAIYQKLRSGATGWGNRIRAMLSTFLFALLDDRVFLVDHDMLEDNFRTPFSALVPIFNATSGSSSGL